MSQKSGFAALGVGGELTRDDVTKALVLWNLAAGRTVTAAAHAEIQF